MARVLIVEDSPTQAQQLAFLLEDAGFETDVRPDAERGLARLRDGGFDLLVTDVNLPGDSGFELCRRVKDASAGVTVPVLVVTAESDPVNVLRGLAAGADGFMTKDHSPAEVVRRVQRTLAGGARTVEKDGHNYAQVLFLGREFLLAVSREQLLNVLLSAFEDVVGLNERLRANEAALRELNGELRRTNDALDNANKVKDRFLGIAAHDMRNPLNVILNLASMSLEGDFGAVTEDQTDALQRIVRQTDGLLALLRDLLDVSALRAGKLEVRPTPQDPRLVLREAFDVFVLAAREKGVRLVWEVPESLPIVDLDFNRILEVLSNLLSNGVKYCRSGQSVHLGARMLESAVEIAVRDTGPGIAEKELPKLFEPFAKLSTVPTAGEKSTGLGLSIVKEIVELHSGTVTADSELGRGTTFRVVLPVRASAG
jgi:signal transduction histidine kinase